MAPIVASTEVARPAEEAFAYVIDLSTMSEWQQGRRARAPGHAYDPCWVQVHDDLEDWRPGARGDHRDHRVPSAAPVGRSGH
jgi:hypothetical protein